MYTARALGLGTGPVVAAAFFDATASYGLVFAAFVTACAVCALLMAITRRPAAVATARPG